MNGTNLLNKLPEHGGKMVKIIITGFPTMAPKTDSEVHLVKPVKPDELVSIVGKQNRYL
jgi:hypothetical protein